MGVEDLTREADLSERRVVGDRRRPETPSNRVDVRLHQHNGYLRVSSRAHGAVISAEGDTRIEAVQFQASAVAPDSCDGPHLAVRIEPVIPVTAAGIFLPAVQSHSS